MDINKVFDQRTSINSARSMKPIAERDGDDVLVKSPILGRDQYDSAQSYFKENKNDPSKPLLQRGDANDNFDEKKYAFFCCTPYDYVYRVILLIFICLLTYGSYFSYDNPGALTAYFKKYICHHDELKYLALYSIYSWPNTIQPFIGGWIIDSYLGVGKSAVVFSGLVLLGSGVVALSGTLYSVFPSESYVPFYIAILGRFIFGLGGESLSVAQSTMTGKWFRGHQLATAFAITLSFSRIGSATNFAVESPIAQAYGFPYALWTSVVFCALSFCVSMNLAYMDKLGEKAKVVEGVKNDRDGKKKEDTMLGGKVGSDSSSADEDKADSDSINCDSIVQAFKPREVLIYMICVSFYVPVFVFISVAAEYFTKKYGVDQDAANQYVAIPYSVSAIASPIMGFLVDKAGYSIQFVALASISLCCIHLTFVFTDVDPAYVMVWMGITYSVCAASLWPMVALIVSFDNLGSAYGLMTALQNLGLAVAPLAIAPILGTTATIGQYKSLEIVFAIISGTSVICSILLFTLDWTCYQGILSASSRDVKTIQAGRLKHLSPTSALEKGLDALLSPNTDQMLKKEEITKLKVRMKHRSQSFSAI